MDQYKSEVLTASVLGFRAKTSYRVEGVLTVTERSGKVVAEDETVNLRDYISKSDVIESLAWEVIESVADHYRPR